MNIVLFSHPEFLGHQSMPRYAGMLAKGMDERGHSVKLWAPKPFFFKLPLPASLKKWMGYIDQYILFPARIKRAIKKQPANTLFVFTDHALGPWVPLAHKKAHIIHCHDFLAQRSAKNEIKELPSVSWSGKLYQSYIRRGYVKGKNFISVSEKTKEDLHHFLKDTPTLSSVVYNGLNQHFEIVDATVARKMLGDKIKQDLTEGFVLHVGGNQWYKNRIGVIEIYDEWRKNSAKNLPLIMIGERPAKDLYDAWQAAACKEDIHFVSGIADEWVRLAYSAATVLLFPSIAEGFGWPIAEAMASGCPVITTNELPMTEVAGGAAFLIPLCTNKNDKKDWLNESALVLNRAVSLSCEERNKLIKNGLINAQRFDTGKMMDSIEIIYEQILLKTNNTSI